MLMLWACILIVNALDMTCTYNSGINFAGFRFF